MDPTVTGAVIAVPTAVLAAVAAYAGARAQARSAHRGPVDAVRRQHQRDAYAAFFAALLAYEAATRWDECRDRVTTAAIAAGAVPGPTLSAEVNERTRQLIEAVPLDEVMRTGAAVDLEGPDHVAAAAMITIGLARTIRSTTSRPYAAVPVSVRVPSAHDRFGDALKEFVKIARAHLNGIDG
ncbi:hypothetical protein ACIP2X_18955 [Streptomyces sp. NPDC089424]|uniref:hypothetical protein n=1 Tax=Streptomyces sp. NPDC089424 TaxID=3365917 RepID=UPI00381E8A8D